MFAVPVDDDGVCSGTFEKLPHPHFVLGGRQGRAGAEQRQLRRSHLVEPNRVSAHRPPRAPDHPSRPPSDSTPISAGREYSSPLRALRVSRVRVLSAYVRSAESEARGHGRTRATTSLHPAGVFVVSGRNANGSAIQTSFPFGSTPAAPVSIWPMGSPGFTSAPPLTSGKSLLRMSLLGRMSFSAA